MVYAYLHFLFLYFMGWFLKSYKLILWLLITGTSWPEFCALGSLSLLHCLFFSLFNSHFMPQQCSTYQTVPTSTCSVYTPLSRCHHSYISCQVELASFSPSCCSTAKNKAPFCEAAMRLQSGPPQGLKLHFLTQWLHFQDSQANLGAAYSWRIRSRWCLIKGTKTILKIKE